MSSLGRTNNAIETIKTSMSIHVASATVATKVSGVVRPSNARPPKTAITSAHPETMASG